MQYSAGTGASTAAGRQMISTTSGAPSGPGTERSSTVYSPPRVSSWFVGCGMIPALRRNGIASAVSGGNGGIAASTAPHSGSYGGGGPTWVVVVISVLRVPGERLRLLDGCDRDDGPLEAVPARADLERLSAVGQRHLRGRVRRDGEV